MQKKPSMSQKASLAFVVLYTVPRMMLYNVGVSPLDRTQVKSLLLDLSRREPVVFNLHDRAFIAVDTAMDIA
jgi:hypothetical protein